MTRLKASTQANHGTEKEESRLTDRRSARSFLIPPACSLTLLNFEVRKVDARVFQLVDGLSERFNFVASAISLGSAA